MRTHGMSRCVVSPRRRAEDIAAATEAAAMCARVSAKLQEIEKLQGLLAQVRGFMVVPYTRDTISKAWRKLWEWASCCSVVEVVQLSRCAMSTIGCQSWGACQELQRKVCCTRK